jgi:undecaprenyl-diphosphatase
VAIQTAILIERIVAHELNLCVWLNHACTYKRIRQFFAIISWLGDGKFWYGLILALPMLYGEAGWTTSIKMIAVGVSGLIIYKLIKARTHRLRPFMVHKAIHLGTTPLDHYSFPSGHTLHAFSFTIIAIETFPGLAWLLIPITALIALSRVILGLHYPSDVGIGASIGAMLAIVSFTL